MSGGRRPLVTAAAAAAALLLVLAFLCGSQAAPLVGKSIPTKDKKSPEVIYYEGAADGSSVDKRVDKSIAAAAIAWPSFREDLRNREKAAAAAAAVAAASRDSGADKLAYDADTSGGGGGAGLAGKAGVASSSGGADAGGGVDDDKALLAEALMRMLMDELEDGGGEDDEVTGSDYSSDDAAYAAGVAGEDDDEEYGNGDALPEAEPPSPELGSSAWADAADRAAPGSAPQRARPAASAAIAPKTTRAPSTTTAVAAATENDGADYDEDNDSREDKRVRVDVSGGVPDADAAATLAGDSSAGDKTTGRGKAEAVEDPYKEYLDMWYRTNIAEDYEEDSVARLRSYLENLKYSKAAEKKPRTKAAGGTPSKSSGAAPRGGKAEPATGGSRKRRSLLDDYDGTSAYVGERELSGGDGVYLTAAEARQLRRLVVGLNEQNDKYAAKLRDLLAAGDSEVGGRARYPEAYGRDDYETSNRNLYRLAYGLADPPAANVGYY